ncbi:aldehyde dehydrogenase family protein [Alcaligenaceae bacterium]|nr:aldehyde dehydrogenase family protein [Alcaligenaceae bacterium]
MTVFSSSSLIGDQWTSDGSTVITHNPSALNDRVGRYLFADASAVDATVSAAHMAFGQWSVLNSFERGRALSRIARELEHLQEEMALLIAKEQGKPIKESRLEAQRAVDIFDYYASETLRASGQILDSVKPGARIEVTR